jgi:uncharacterized repeat protein (TIGR02543 family)
MRESVGSSLLLKIVMIFIVIYACFLSIAVNYSLAFRTKNALVSIIEKYEGVDKAADALKEYISTVKYNNNIDIDSIITTDCNPQESSYCISQKYTQNGDTYYKVVVYLKFDFPLLGNIFLFPISGETKIINDYSKVSGREYEIIEQDDTIKACTNDEYEFINWDLYNVCDELSNIYSRPINANYRKCVDNAWVNQTKIIYPTTNKDNSIVYIFNEGGIYNEKKLDLSNDYCNSKYKINVLVDKNYIDCGSGITINTSKNTYNLKASYIPTNTYYRNLKWEVIEGKQYLDIYSANNTSNFPTTSTNAVSTAQISITDAAKKELESKQSVYAVVKATNEKGTQTTCKVTIKDEGPTCSIAVKKVNSNWKAILTFYSKKGIKEAGLSTSSTPVYNYKNNTYLNTGMIAQDLKIGSGDYYYGFVKDQNGNTGTCTSEKIKKTKSKIEYYKGECEICMLGASGCFSGRENFCAATLCSTYECTKSRTVYYCDDGYTKLNDNYCIKSYDITLDYNEDGGNNIANGSCTFLKDLTLPGTPTKDGYTFVAWRLANNALKKSNEKISGGCIDTYIGVSSGVSKSITAVYCESCHNNENSTCKINVNSSKGTCSYQTSCKKGYYISSGKNTANPICYPNSYITLDWNEDGGNSIPNGYCEYGKSDLVLPDAPFKEGYTFIGWKLPNKKEYFAAGTVIKNGCVKDYIGVKTQTSDKIKAMWDKSEITIDYNENGGSSVENGTCTYTKNFNLTNNVPTKEGYTFNGWKLANNSSKASKAQITCNSTNLGDVSSGTSTSITANWCENCHEVENGTCTLNAKSPGTCSYTTKCNKGYYISSGDKTANPTCSLDGDITVDYNENGGSSVENGICRNGVITLPSAPIRDNYTFIGWKLNGKTIANANATIACNSTNLGVSKGVSKDKVVAQWKLNIITIDWNEDGGSSVENGTCTYNGKLTATKTVPQKENYVFAGWKLLTGKSLNTGAYIDKGCTLENIGVNSGTSNYINAVWCHVCLDIKNGKCELTKHKDATCTYKITCDTGYSAVNDGNYNSTCEPNIITILWNEDGGESVEDSTCTFNDSLITAPAPKKEGYIFNGWLLGDNHTIVPANYEIKNGCNKTNTKVVNNSTKAIKAVWSKSDITIDYNEDGGSSVENGKCTYDGKFKLPTEKPVREGYTFNGWKLANNSSKAAKNEITCNSSNLGDVSSGTSTSITANWCHNCETDPNGTCTLNAKSPGTCTYTTKCNKGYNLINGGSYNFSCVPK